METVRVYNVAVPVVELVLAESESDALARVRAALERDGYQVYEGGLPDGFSVFESEDQETSWRVATCHRHECYPGCEHDPGDGNDPVTGYARNH